MTFLHTLIIALMNGCKVAAGRQEAVCVVVSEADTRRRMERREGKGRGRRRRRRMGMAGSIHCN